MLHLISSAGKKLLTGTKRECKEYIKEHGIQDYQITDNYIEKVAIPKGELTPQTSIFKWMFK